MAMSRFEKLFVNRKGKGRRNAAKVVQRLEGLDKNPIQDVLEIGCGIGTVSAILSETYGFKVTGIDFDPKQIEEARRLHSETENLQYQVEDAANMSFGDQSFDLVIAHNVFHHIPDWRVAFGEVKRLLRHGGNLMWLDIVFIGPVRSLLAVVEKEESFFSLDEIVETTEALGYEERFHERTPLLLFSQQHFVFQKP